MYAVLVLQMQRDFVDEGFVYDVGEAARTMFPALHKLLDVARERKVPVLYGNLCLHKDDPLPLAKQFLPHGVPGTAGFEVTDEFKPQDIDYVVNAKRMDAFIYSDLEFILKTVVGADTVIITGVTTDPVCLLTAMDAVQRGFDVIVVSDCCAARKVKSHEEALNYLGRFVKVLKADEVIELLRK